MAYSGTYTFTVTRDDVIRESMLNNGQLYETDVPTAQEATDLARKLNMIVKQWQAKADFAPGLKQWTNIHAELFLSNAAGSFAVGNAAQGWAVGANVKYITLTATAAANATALTVSSIVGISSTDIISICLDSGALFWTTVNGAPAGSTINITTGITSQATSGANVFSYPASATPVRPERILTAVLRDINNNDIPLSFMTLEDRELLPTKTQTTYVADPQSLYYEYQLNSLNQGKIYLDVGACADVTKHIHLVYLSPVQDFVTATDTPHYPQAWFSALSWQLAKESAPMFNKQWSQTQEDLRREAIAIAREQFPETTSLYFQCKSEGTYRSPG